MTFDLIILRIWDNEETESPRRKRTRVRQKIKEEETREKMSYSSLG